MYGFKYVIKIQMKYLIEDKPLLSSWKWRTYLEFLACSETGSF